MNAATQQQYFIKPVNDIYGFNVGFGLFNMDLIQIGHQLDPSCSTFVDQYGRGIGNLNSFGDFILDRNYINDYDYFSEEDNLSEEDYANMAELEEMIESQKKEEMMDNEAAAALEAAALEAAALEAVVPEIRDLIVSISQKALDTANDILSDRLSRDHKRIVSLHHFMLGKDGTDLFKSFTNYRSGFFRTDHPLCDVLIKTIKRLNCRLMKCEFAEMLYIVPKSSKNPQIMFKKKMRNIVELGADVPNQQLIHVVLEVV